MSYSIIKGTIKQETWLDDVKDLSLKIKPDWKVSDLQVSEVNGRSIHGMYRCQNLYNESNSLVFRVFDLRGSVEVWKDEWDNSGVKECSKNSGTQSKHHYEITVLRDMGELGLASKLHARFDNGICYDYVDGTVLTPTRIRDNPSIVDQLARMIGKLHSYQPSTELLKYKNETRNLIGTPEEMIEWFGKMIPIFKKAKDKRFKEIVELVGDVEKEVRDITTDTLNNKSKLVWCHGDLHLSNIIYNAKTGGIKFIDWEMTNYNYPEMEIGPLWAQFCGHVPDGYDLSFYPTKENQKRFLQIYLESYHSNLGSKEINYEKEIKSLHPAVNRAMLTSQLYFGMSGAFQVARNEIEGVAIEDDLLDYALTRIKAYRLLKDEILKSLILTLVD